MAQVVQLDHTHVPRVRIEQKGLQAFSKPINIFLGADPLRNRGDSLVC